ncbi:hypothetical protein BAUCODRAFT_68395 [Baudoinia panamericana UAMH 10762]|uniref:TPR-like protein n=1 Tax=Baudoinia panamericana (strain UAMH 10762) TaxID=717646 RepID=M2LRH0_BAUPA|nr:uncharacterized protein BAUCODRAFT_68395 [Baudoinia panamericana UAMH 10762]EMC97032.1 hypothetical protein BAUCODRAFT_68395 [Baudoinia panamericana UAMH 10762]
MALTNGHVNGTNGVNGHAHQLYGRFSDIPAVIDIPVRGEDGEEAVNLDLVDLIDETDELCDLLENENAARNYWITIALAYAKQKKVAIAIDILQKGLGALRAGRGEDRLSMLSCLCWLYLWMCRRAVRKPMQSADDVPNKDYWLKLGTQTLNDASRINPSYAPLYLARGTLYLLRASMQTPKERADTLKQAAKSFDEAYRLSGQKNIMAVLGKARVQFSLGRFAESLALYQQALQSAPDMLDPDPRIGIGCCLWQLEHKDAARGAWQRSLDLKPDENIIANVLLGLSYLDESSQYASSDSQFRSLYSKAMTVHTQAAFKMDAMHALTSATLGEYFLRRQNWDNVERLGRRAVEQTDVGAIASDGWYLMARKEHYLGTDLTKAAEHYNKADVARGGDEKGFLPAKFGGAQLKTLMGDLDGAKFRLDKIISGSNAATGGGQKSVEAMTLLGMLYAEEVFANQAAAGKEDKTVEQKKAIGLLEQVRVIWKDPKRKGSPDAAVLLNLARLYEQEQPEKALACLQHVEQMELDDIADDDERLPDEIGEATEERRAKRELLSPQLLNNIGCFHFQADRFTEAREDFQTALNSCVKMGERDASLDTDALVSTISYNLARTYEAEGMNEEARRIYDGLLERHPNYTDANARLAYLSLSAAPADGAEAIKQLMESDPSNLESRALYGWYLHRSKKRTHNLPEDVEQKHYKDTLQKFDKHDMYSLVGMGNLHLAVAREMRRETDQDKDRRSKTYMRAVEFFDKVLTLDPRNAFAAQGLGIAMAEDKKDTNAAIQIFSKVRESLKGLSGSVHLNLGHVFAEMRQWSRSIENYELALSRSAKERADGKPDPQILACLGRVWLMRGRQEKKLEAYQTSLDLSKQALELAPENVSFRFNVAFVQIQLTQLLIGLPEAQKSLQDVEQAGHGLDDAINAFIEIAKSPNPPFPRGDLEARANMGRNTMKRQLAGAMEKQAEYERKNASRLEEARRRREEEIKKREDDKRKAEEAAEEQRRKVKEERDRMAEEDREMVRRKLEEDRAREEAEMTVDEETGERKKRERKPREKRQKRKKKRRSRATSGEPGTGSEAEPGRRKKRRKLERKGQAVRASKYKSKETVEESDEDEDGDGAVPAEGTEVGGDGDEEVPMDEAMGEKLEEEQEAAARPMLRKKAARVLHDDEDEDEDEDGAAAADGDAAMEVNGVGEPEDE